MTDAELERLRQHVVGEKARLRAEASMAIVRAATAVHGGEKAEAMAVILEMAAECVLEFAYRKCPWCQRSTLRSRRRPDGRDGEPRYRVECGDRGSCRYSDEVTGKLPWQPPFYTLRASHARPDLPSGATGAKIPT